MTEYQQHQPRPVAEIIGEKGVEGIGLLSAWAGYRAYQNHMEAGYPLQDSMWKGAITARRWLVFGFLFAGWMVWFAIAFFGWYMTHRVIPNNAEFTAATTNAPLEGARFTINLIIYVVASLLVFGIQHNRIITGGLHRRTWLFKIFQVPYTLTLWIPSFFLYLILFVLPITWG
jgi:hypothetical protein